jgi:hypothetical protein
MPRERGNPKRGPTYYNYLANRNHNIHPSLTDSMPPSLFTPPASPSAILSPNALSLDEDEWGLVPVVEEFPSDPTQIIVGPSTVPSTEISQTTSSQVRGNSGVQLQEGYWSCVVVEEVTPMGMAVEAPTEMTQDIWNSQEEFQHFDTPLSCGFSAEQLQLIFDMRRTWLINFSGRKFLAPDWMPYLILSPASLSIVVAQPVANLSPSLQPDIILL